MALPTKQEIGHRARLHPAHGLELTRLLAVEQLTVITEHGDCGDAFVQRNLIVRGDVDIGVIPSNVDVHQNVIGLEQRPVGRIVKVQIENMAIGAPIAAKVQDHAFVGRRGALERGGKVSRGLFRRRINVR